MVHVVKFIRNPCPPIKLHIRPPATKPKMPLKRTRKSSYILLVGIILSILSIVWLYDPFELNSSFETLELNHSLMNERSTPGKQNKNGKKVNNTKSAVVIEGYSSSIVSYELPDELAPLNTVFKAVPPQVSTVKEVENDDFINTLKEVPLRTEFPIGIKNPRNFCYANSVIQSLFRIPTVRKLVANLDVYHSWAETKVNELKESSVQLEEKCEHIEAKAQKIQRTEIIQGLHVAEGLNHMFQQLQTLPKGSHAIYSKAVTKCMPNHFADQDQEDADEYLTAMIGYLQGILPVNQRKHLVIRIANFSVHKSLEPTPVRVENRPMTLDSLFRLSLPIKSVKRKTLTNLIKKAFESEKIELKFENDNKPGELCRFIRLHSLPDIFPVQLQRLFRRPDGRLTKISDKIAMPIEYDFSQFFHEDALRSFGDAKYRLKIIIKHSGTAYGGHYYVFVRKDDEKWYLLNDSSASIYTGNIEEVLISGYIYFYERVKTSLLE